MCRRLVDQDDRSIASAKPKTAKAPNKGVAAIAGTALQIIPANPNAAKLSADTVEAAARESPNSAWMLATHKLLE
jgi:hypothetical protein